MDYSENSRSGPNRRYSRQDGERQDRSRITGDEDMRDRPGPTSSAPQRFSEDAAPAPPPPPPPGVVYRGGSRRKPSPRVDNIVYGDSEPSLRRSDRPDIHLSGLERQQRRDREEPVEDLEMPRIRRDVHSRREDEAEFDQPGPSSRRPLYVRPPSYIDERAQYEDIRIRRPVQIPQIHDEIPLRPRPTVERPLESRHRDFPRHYRMHSEMRPDGRPFLVDIDPGVSDGWGDLPPHERPPYLRPYSVSSEPIDDEVFIGRDGRLPPREAPRVERPPRHVRRGYVQPAPPLMRLEKRGGRHDLATLAQRPSPNAGEDIGDSLVLAVYRNSKKSYDIAVIDLVLPGRSLETRFAITDRELFRSMRTKYQSKLHGWFRRIFSFKGLSSVRLLQVSNNPMYGDDQLFRPQQDDDLFPLKFMKVWHNPHQQLQTHSRGWVMWVMKAKRLHPDFDMAIELVEDYIPERIVLFVGAGLIGIVALTCAWLVEGGDPGLVSTVMSFALGFVAAVVALTGIWDFFDGGRSEEIRKGSIAVLPKAPQDTPWAPRFYDTRPRRLEEKEEFANEKRRLSA